LKQSPATSKPPQLRPRSETPPDPGARSPRALCRLGRAASRSATATDAPSRARGSTSHGRCPGAGLLSRPPSAALAPCSPHCLPSTVRVGEASRVDRGPSLMAVLEPTRMILPGNFSAPAKRLRAEHRPAHAERRSPRTVSSSATEEPSLIRQSDAASGGRCSGRSSTCSPHPSARRAGVTRRAACCAPSVATGTWSVRTRRRIRNEGALSDAQSTRSTLVPQLPGTDGGA
jgi:hypothetical protein